MSQIREKATIVGRAHARLKDSAGPMTIRQVAESLQCGTAAVQYAMKTLRNQGVIRRVPYRPLDGVGSERYGWEYVRKEPNPHTVEADVQKLRAAFAPAIPDDIKIRVNEDCPITIITDKIRITVEVPR